MRKVQDIRLYELCLNLFRRVLIEKINRLASEENMPHFFNKYVPPFICKIRSLREIKNLLQYFYENNELYMNTLSLLAKYFNNVFEADLLVENNFENLLLSLSSLKENDRFKAFLRMRKHKRDLMLEVFIDHLINGFIEECRWRVLECKDYEAAFKTTYEEFEEFLYTGRSKVKVIYTCYAPFAKEDIKYAILTKDIRLVFNTKEEVFTVIMILNDFSQDHLKFTEKVIELLAFSCHLLKPGIAFCNLTGGSYGPLWLITPKASIYYPEYSCPETLFGIVAKEPMYLTRNDILILRDTFKELMKLYNIGRWSEIEKSLRNFRKSFLKADEKERLLFLIMSLERLLFFDKERSSSKELVKRVISVLTKMRKTSLVLGRAPIEVREIIIIAYQMRNRLAHGRDDLMI